MIDARGLDLIQLEGAQNCKHPQYTFNALHSRGPAQVSPEIRESSNGGLSSEDCPFFLPSGSLNMLKFNYRNGGTYFILVPGGS